MGVGDDIREMIAGIEATPGVTLSPVERLLLATDGTVTHMMEALTREPVAVNIISRQVNGGRLARKVALERSSDGSVLAWADSELVLYHLPEDLEDELVHGDLGIGRLLRQHYAETRRSIETMGVLDRDGDDIPAFVDDHCGRYYYREYAVYSNENRMMEIREYFPDGFY